MRTFDHALRHDANKSLGFVRSVSKGADNINWKRHSEANLLYEGAFIIIYFLRHSIHDVLLYSSPQQFYESYPQLRGYLGAGEEAKLVNYANMIRICLRLSKGKAHKHHLSTHATRLCEGVDVRYVTGGGAMTNGTRWRQMIFQFEAG
jgi:hypothetical protein